LKHGNQWLNWPNPRLSLQTWKLTLAYDGTDFSGWQVQPEERTIQGELQAALGRITGESPLPQGSGRTDAGVHALAQVASFALQAPIPACKPASGPSTGSCLLRSAFWRREPYEATSMRGTRRWQKPMSTGFSVEKVCPPFLAAMFYPYRWPIDFEALQSQASCSLKENTTF
jgi:tRNA pseudouridine38-40 synthase